MVIDTSVIVTLIKPEPDWRLFLQPIRTDPHRLFSTASYLEASMVLSGMKRSGRASLDRLLARLSIQLVAFTPEHALIAADAFSRFGKGRGGRAQLNFGDCMVYALAKAADEALLFKGDDFAHTDVARVL